MSKYNTEYDELSKQLDISSGIFKSKTTRNQEKIDGMQFLQTENIHMINTMLNTIDQEVELTKAVDIGKCLSTSTFSLFQTTGDIWWTMWVNEKLDKKAILDFFKYYFSRDNYSFTDKMWNQYNSYIPDDSFKHPFKWLKAVDSTNIILEIYFRDDVSSIKWRIQMIFDLPDTCNVEYVEELVKLDDDNLYIDEDGQVFRTTTKAKVNCSEKSVLKSLNLTTSL